MFKINIIKCEKSVLVVVMFYGKNSYLFGVNFLLVKEIWDV